MASEKKSRQLPIRFELALQKIIDETRTEHIQSQSFVIRAAVHHLGRVPLAERKAILAAYRDATEGKAPPPAEASKRRKAP